MKPIRWWQKVLCPEQLRLCAGQRVYERGEHYRNTARVVSTQLTDDELIAQVQGTQLYTVRLWRRGQQLQSACACPFASEGAFCKHAVAVALTVHAKLTADD